MNNKEKAHALIKVLERPFSGEFLVEMLEDELNRLDAPEPKKWEPRGGYYHVGFVTSRMYPTSFEAERAAPLHRKLDRLVNWLVENSQDDIKLRTDWDSTSVRIHLQVSDPVIDRWVKGLDSGEIEL